MLHNRRLQRLVQCRDQRHHGLIFKIVDPRIDERHRVLMSHMPGQSPKEIRLTLTIRSVHREDVGVPLVAHGGRVETLSKYPMRSTASSWRLKRSPAQISSTVSIASPHPLNIVGRRE
jgi:hypothetical protein